MNHDDDLIDPAAAVNRDSDRTLIDTFLDGERVTGAALREALGRSDARDYFVDMLLLRQMAIEMDPDAPRAPTSRSSRARGTVRWLAAAAVLVATAATGYVVGRGEQPVAEPPGPAISIAAPVSDAPAPTRTVRFERGRNWISNLGEN